MKNEFGLKKVTIHIDQTPLERKKGLYYLRAVEFSSPLQCYANANEIGKTFGIWLTNTISAMDKNNAKLIKIVMSWE